MQARTGGAVDLDRAGAAHAVLAAHVRPREPQVVTEEIGQELADRHGPLHRPVVDDELDLERFDRLDDALAVQPSVDALATSNSQRRYSTERRSTPRM